jgi:hypothetical protein
LARVSGFAASPDGRELAAVAAFVPAGETNDARRDEKARTGAVVVDDAEAFVGEIRDARDAREVRDVPDVRDEAR